MTPKAEALPRHYPWSELLRIALLVAAAIGVMHPYFTGNIVGGVDARWYAYMLGDYIEQVHKGHLLVTVGQGELAWNGSVHLYRSAPVYMAVGRVADLLTFGRLNLFALEHMTVVVSAVAGTVGFYIAAAKVLPSMRWTASGFALLYLLTPSWLSTIVHAEAYMSYMAFAAMPVVLYGNARTALKEDGKGYVTLGAGLALLWMCHPPIAFLTTLTTALLQCGLVVSRGVVSWAEILKGGAAFCILSAFYFTSMGELPPLGETHGMRGEVLVVGGVILFIMGLGRAFTGGSPLGWGACAAAGILAVGSSSRPWLCWVAGTAVVWTGFAALWRLCGVKAIGRHAAVILFVSAISGAAIAEAWVGREGIFTGAIQNLSANTAHLGSWFRPLATPADPYSIFQPGWALWCCVALGFLSILGARPTGARLFFLAAIGLLVFFFRVPLASNFLVGRFPPNFAVMCGVPLDLRMAPVIASFAVMGGVVWLASAGWTTPMARRATIVVLSALVAWGALECMHLRRHVLGARGAVAYTERNLRTENAVLDAYAYLLLPIPSYFSHGKMDPLLESRLLDARGSIIVGPTQAASAMEARGVRRFTLKPKLMPNSLSWFQLGDTLTVAPGAHLLLRFAFDPNVDCRGFLILQAEHSYREYHFPDSGLDRAFGIGGDHTSVLSIWNSGTQPEHYALLLSSEPGNTISRSGDPCGTLFVSDFDPEKLPITVSSFIPYRARVDSETGGTLETFRVFMPGYRATVDGVQVPVRASKEHLVSLAVPPGKHEVAVEFVGSRRLWISGAISALGWIGLLGACALGASRHRKAGLNE